MTTWLQNIADAAPAAHPAIIDHDGAVFSYGQLRAGAKEIAVSLRTHGVRPGDRVMLACENCAAYVGALLALAALDAWILPINARHSAAELDAIAIHSGARAIVFSPAASPDAASHAARLSTAPLGATGLGPLAVTPCEDSAAEPVGPEPDARIAALLYTTGTTSAPKGVLLTHANLIWNAETSARLRGMTPGDVVLGVLPGSHIFGFSSTILAALHAGSTLRLIPRFTPEAVLRAFAEGASVLPAVPQMYERVLTHLDRTGAALLAPKLRYISAGGAPLDPDLKAQTEAVFGLTLNNGYGITECAPGVAATRPGHPRSDVSVGTAMEDVELTIDAPDAEGVGEILIRSPGVMKGYYRNPHATAAALPEPGLFRSGDLGRIDPDGTVHVLGRKKELIIRSGFNVHPPEIEGMLTRHPDVLQAAVVGRRVGANEEILAFVMARGGLTDAALADWLEPRLVAYKRPQRIVIAESLPTAPTGKILKHKLIDHFTAELDQRLQLPQGDPAA
ncbi:MAG: AMP-binding protein [Rhodobacter sp.]|nr:AMP-binding protein [Rhodobacter sp.]